MSLSRPGGAERTSPAHRLLTGLALDLAARESLWQPAVRFDEQQRVVTRLPGPPGVEVWLSTWLPGQASDLHDHGSTAAALAVVRGTLVESALDEHERPVELHLGTGCVAALEPGARHSVRNDGPQPAVSIHVRTSTGG
ncbi:cysteine dioxygenase family protein [Quadrisphaera sp. DSM 44207]|uniref:cysteine dioxygenase n=1 Tax=Quadrisphaera sp. DSM 44207 TaxID=1881057 RepID=UPI0015A1625A|nr:cysteine dioxygenase family protein [Quadrisphaera sp. DSM 44207]